MHEAVYFFQKEVCLVLAFGGHCRLSSGEGPKPYHATVHSSGGNTGEDQDSREVLGCITVNGSLQERLELVMARSCGFILENFCGAVNSISRKMG